MDYFHPVGEGGRDATLRRRRCHLKNIEFTIAGMCVDGGAALEGRVAIQVQNPLCILSIAIGSFSLVVDTQFAKANDNIRYILLLVSLVLECNHIERIDRIDFLRPLMSAPETV